MSNTSSPVRIYSVKSQGSHVGPLMLLAVTIAGIALILLLTATGVSPSPLTWYLARASGFTLYVLFWLSVVSGLALTTRVLDPAGGRATWWRVHGMATELGFVFLALHMLSLAVDPTEPLGLLGVLLPFTTDVRQPWTDIGILTAFGMLLITVSFNLRRFLGAFGWRLLHYGAFPLWLMALVHGMGSGSDTTGLWALLLYGITSGIVIFLILYRVLISLSQRYASAAHQPSAEYVPISPRHETVR